MSGHGRVLVTGASGFIGRDLSVRLVRQGWQPLPAVAKLATEYGSKVRFFC